jgi:rSAM/selenodomain-associated transferase 2
MVSLVIPVLDEEKLLPGTLAVLLQQVRTDGVEVIVVDGGSIDSTVEKARGMPAVSLVTSPPGRGRQMNAGAREARGSLLVFLPADTLLPRGAVCTLEEIDRAGMPAAGGFRQRFDRERTILRIVSVLHNARARLTGAMYGDQVPFVRKDLFLGLGGFREDIDMEDVEFAARLKRRTRPHLLDLIVTTSSRRFDRAGDLRATFQAAVLLASWGLFRRVPRSKTFFSPVR